jgi:hypothetical protein
LKPAVLGDPWGRLDQSHALLTSTNQDGADFPILDEPGLDDEKREKGI